MDYLSWILIGFIAGFLAKYVVPSQNTGGFLADIVLGIVGAFVGGWIMRQFGGAPVAGFNLYSILVAFGGAVILLLIARTISGRRAI